MEGKTVYVIQTRTGAIRPEYEVFICGKRRYIQKGLKAKREKY